jgi:hypothetical protein
MKIWHFAFAPCASLTERNVAMRAFSAHHRQQRSKEAAEVQTLLLFISGEQSHFEAFLTPTQQVSSPKLEQRRKAQDSTAPLMSASASTLATDQQSVPSHEGVVRKRKSKDNLACLIIDIIAMSKAHFCFLAMCEDYSFSCFLACLVFPFVFFGSFVMMIMIIYLGFRKKRQTETTPSHYCPPI